jgi:hypothetical protein
MWTNWLAAIGVAAAVASGITALFAVVIQLRAFNKQLTIQIYSDYTKRYQEIVLLLPEDIFEAGFVLPRRPNDNQIVNAMRIYFDLCFEEWHLHKRKLIREDIWTIWHQGIRTALSRPAFVQAWPIIKNSSEFGEEFEAFIDKNLALHGTNDAEIRQRRTGAL